MSESRTTEEWREYIEGCLDFRPDDGVFRIARDVFTEPRLFDLEMEHIFEKTWVYACHESEIPQPHDYVTIQVGRQPLIITRDGKGELHALINACQRREDRLGNHHRGDLALKWNMLH